MHQLVNVYESTEHQLTEDPASLLPEQGVSDSSGVIEPQILSGGITPQPAPGPTSSSSGQNV